MTRISVHALGTDRLLASGENGRRWVIAAPASLIDDAAVRTALATLRASGKDGPPPQLDRAVAIASLHELRNRVDGGNDAPYVAWSYGGRSYRVLRSVLCGDGTADAVIALMLALVADPEQAAALAGPAIEDDILEPSGRRHGEPTARSTQRSRTAPEPLAMATHHHQATAQAVERWEDGSWVAHRLDPAPLVDPVTGVLHRIVERPTMPDAPPGFVHLHAELPHLSSVDPRFQPDQLAPAGALRGGRVPPSDAAVLSGIAHQCGAYLEQGTVRIATAAELRAHGEAVLTVSEWRPHDPTLHALTGFPFVRDHDELRMPWLLGAEGEARCWVPLSLVHAGYLASGFEDLPSTNGHNFVGLQAGWNREHALDRAAAHLIAQDAVARWWRGGDRLAASALPGAAIRALGDCAWQVTMRAVPSPFGVPVRIAMVDDRAHGTVALGYGCAAREDDAAELALSEALVQHASARDLQLPSSLIRNSQALGNGGVAGLADFDEERDYRAAFADRRSMIDPMCHVQYGLDPQVVEHTRQRMRATARAAAPAVTERADGPYAALRSHGVRLVVVDVTTPRVRPSAHAVRILAPSLSRLQLGAFEDAAWDGEPYPGW